MPPFHEDDRVTVHHGDCLEVLRTLPDCSVDSVVTDPPAGVSFMGREWDTDKGGRDAWVAWLASVLAECRRILKPGGHALVWALPRTSGWTHRAIEDADLDVRDCITHLFGSGFPKSLDVGKAIDRAAGVEREVAGFRTSPFTAAGAGIGGHTRARHASEGYRPDGDSYPHESLVDANGYKLIPITAPATEDAARWDGWGTALKPASEMWYLARKPLTSTVAANVTAWGTGALNIAATRVPGALDGDPNRFAKTDGGSFASFGDRPPVVRSDGRWPSNVVLTHSPTDPEDGCEPSCPVAELDAQSGEASYNPPARWVGGTAITEGWGNIGKNEPGTIRGGYGDRGGASRFFPVFRYQAKAPTRERPKVDGVAHPTVKPVALIRWLARLVTPQGGTVLDPFGGSGSTVEACLIEGFRCITIEREVEYLPLILERIRRQQPPVEVKPAAQQMSLLDDSAA